MITEIVYKGCGLTVNYDYQPHEPADNEYPGAPEQVTINSIVYDSDDVHDIYDSLGQIENIEYAILKSRSYE